MAIVIDTNPSKHRAPTPEEAVDHEIGVGDFFGTTGDQGTQVWHFDGAKAVRVGIANLDERSMTELGAGEDLRQAIKRVPMFANADFVIHRMELPPGAYFPRMSRPNDQHPLEAPGMLPDFSRSPDLMAGTLNQMRSLVGMLDAIFQAVHPTQTNMTCYGSAVRNLLILACTECEAQWRGILTANRVTPARPSTADYVKLNAAMRLSEYAVKLQHYPWLNTIAPFATWDAEAPTRSLAWYDDYNAAKHDREESFARATVGAAIEAVAALWIMVAAQFGIHGVREFDDLHRYFHLERVPLWRYSQVYTYGYDGFDAGAGPFSFPF